MSTNLYSGSAGVVLFYLELHAATGDPRHLDIAGSGAWHLQRAVRHGEQTDPGLYTGLAEIGYERQLYSEVRSPDKTAWFSCLKPLEEMAVETGAGVQWNDSTDVISGSAGIGFFLLWLAERPTLSEEDRDQALDLAAEAGNRLVEVGEEVGEDGMRWRMTPANERHMPNFSHGTAGIATFLSELYTFKKRKRYRESAAAGARYLVSIADTSDGFCVHHHEPDGEDLYYLGWCHGPPGTARLFHSPRQSTRERSWNEWERRAADSLHARLPGRTELLHAQTGYMQGSSGIGLWLWLLHLNAFEQGRQRLVRLPDDPN